MPKVKKIAQSGHTALIPADRIHISIISTVFYQGNCNGRKKVHSLPPKVCSFSYLWRGTLKQQFHAHFMLYFLFEFAFKDTSETPEQNGTELALKMHQKAQFFCFLLYFKITKWANENFSDLLPAKEYSFLVMYVP